MTFQEIFKRTFAHLAGEFKGRKVLDVPAGEGLTSQWLAACGAEVTSLDLFPEKFNAPGLMCGECDLNESIPLSDGSMEFIISQEGIEHLSDQVNAFKEFARVLKPQGKLILTCPNGSGLSLKISHLLGECEKHGRIMSPNLHDSIWHSSKHKDKTYFGHLFIPTVTKLRVMAQVAGFDLLKIHFSEFKPSNFFWFVLLYPFIFGSQLRNYLRQIRKFPEHANEYKIVFWLSVNPVVLIDGSLALEFQKR